MFMVNGVRDELVGLDAGERLQQALSETKTLRRFDGGHAEPPPSCSTRHGGSWPDQLQAVG